jgi:tetratricopeptide (TPR) repeat protein
MSVEKHLANARKFYSQSRFGDAIYEYRLVLGLDPNNEEAQEGLRQLTDGPGSPEQSQEEQFKSSGRIRTNFLAHQAEETSKPMSKQAPMMVLLVVLCLGLCYGLYQCVVYYINYDKNVAMKYVEVRLEKPEQKDGSAYVSVVIQNYNPQEIKDTTFNYKITASDGALLASANVTIPNVVPAGELRTFSQVKLAPLKGQAAHMYADLVDLHLGPKPNLTPEHANKFIEAAALKPENAVADLTEFVKHEPEFEPGYVRLGQALLASNDNEHAIKAFEKAIKLNGEDANAHYHLGVAYFYKPDKEAARKELEQAAQLAPDDPIITGALKQVGSKNVLPDEKPARAGEASDDKDAEK